MRHRWFLAAAVALAAFVQVDPMAAETAPSYKVTRTVALGAPDNWDYVVFDASTSRVFVAHGDRLTVVDGVSGTIVGNIEGLSTATHGIGISTATGHGYTDDSETGQAGAFDLNTLKPIGKIKAEADADAIAVDPVTGHVFVVDGDSGKITVIDPKADAPIATIDVGGKLEEAVADGKGKLFVNSASSREILRIDTATNKLDARWPVPDCQSPHGLAADLTTRRLFTSCANAVLVVVDPDSGATIAKLPIGKGTDGAAFDPKRKLIFSSNGGDGTLSVLREVDAQHFEVAATIPTVLTARTMAIDPETGRLYLVAADVEPGTLPGTRPKRIPGSLKLLFLDPAP